MARDESEDNFLRSKHKESLYFIIRTEEIRHKNVRFLMTVTLFLCSIENILFLKTQKPLGNRDRIKSTCTHLMNFAPPGYKT